MLGHGSFHFVPCIPPFSGCFGLFLIGKVSSIGIFSAPVLVAHIIRIRNVILGLDLLKAKYWFCF